MAKCVGSAENVLSNCSISLCPMEKYVELQEINFLPSNLA
jgi:hypothetical protein